LNGISRKYSLSLNTGAGWLPHIGLHYHKMNGDWGQYLMVNTKNQTPDAENLLPDELTPESEVIPGMAEKRKRTPPDRFVYYGPTRPGLLHGTVFRGKVPDSVEMMIKDNPVLREAIVPFRQFGRARMALRDETSPEAGIYAMLSQGVSVDG